MGAGRGEEAPSREVDASPSLQRPPSVAAARCARPALPVIAFPSGERTFAELALTYHGRHGSARRPDGFRLHQCVGVVWDAT
jgi:hypothetical protein